MGLSKYLPLIVGGIDEAGRGPVIGSMIIAGITIGEKQIESLKLLGVKDSKLLSPKKRETLYDSLIKFPHQVFKISPTKIDAMVKVKRLNYLEAVYFAKTIDSLSNPKKPFWFYVDCPDVNTERFRDLVMSLQKKSPRHSVKAEHHADTNYTVVGAASILAKVTRDREIEKLKHRLEVNFGSGYPSDPLTIAFLRGLLKQGAPLPPYVRKSWKTCQRLS